jgi:hypothetical protein
VRAVCRVSKGSHVAHAAVCRVLTGTRSPEDEVVARVLLQSLHDILFRVVSGAMVVVCVLMWDTMNVDVEGA